MKPFDLRMHDDSRNFAYLPETASFDSMRKHLRSLPGVVETGFLTDEVTVMWLDFEFGGHEFSINNQMGDYWFFVDDPECDDELLRTVVEHFEKIRH